MDLYGYSSEHVDELLIADEILLDVSDYSKQTLLDNTSTDLSLFKSQHTVIQELERNVSRLQTAANGIDQVFDVLKDLTSFLDLEVSFKPKLNIPHSVINNFITEKLVETNSICQTTTFTRKGLLNGESGVIGKTTGKGLQFVRGSALVKSSGEKGYTVQITKVPQASILMGAARLSPDIIRNEQYITIKDQKREVCYELKPNESAASLIRNLQIKLNLNGFDVSVFQSRNNYLILKHNEFGDHTHFTGLSNKTSLLSKIPGEWEEAQSGQNVAGYINREPAHGAGGYLVGDPGNYRTDGIVLYFNGSIHQVGEIIGKVFIKQNGIQVPLSVDQAEMDLISLPSIKPENMSVGVSNACGFMNLSMIQSNNALENIESVKLIHYAMDDLKDLQTELKRKENHYVELAISLLRNPVASKEAGISVVSCSHEKANEMAEQIKLMLNPSELCTA